MKKLDEAEVKKWQSRIKASMAWREEKEKTWKRIIDYLKGKFFETEESEDQVSVNLVHPSVKVTIPAIYSKNPEILVRARRPEEPGMEDTALAIERYIKYVVKEINIKEEFKLSLLDALLIGHGWNKQGFQTDFINEGDQVPSEELPIIQRILSIFKPVQQIDPEERYAIQPDERIVAERIWSIRTSPFDVYLPAFTRRLPGIPWIAEKIIRPTEDVQNNPNYSNADKVRPTTDIAQLLGLKDKQFDRLKYPEFETEDMQLTALFEVWDLRTMQIYTIPDPDNAAVCLEQKDNEYHFLDKHYPYEMLRFNDVPDEVYPYSDIEPWEPQIHELNKTRTQMIRHRKRYNRRYLSKEGSLTDEAKDALRSGEDGAIVETNEENIQTSLQPIIDAPLPAEVYAVESRIKDDIVNISGITDYQRGSLAQGAKTATEAAIVQNQSGFRTDERLDVVGTWATAIFRNICMISLKFMSQVRVAEIIGQDLAQYWPGELDDEDLTGEFIYDIVFGSSVPVNRDIERQQFLQLYELTANDPYFNPVKIREELLRMFDKRNVEEWLNPQVAQMLQQQRLMQLQAAGASQDTTDTGGGGVGGNEAANGGAPVGVPTTGDIMGGINKRLGLRQPGGVGGGALV